MKRNFLKLLVSVFALFIIGNVNAQAPFKYLTYIFPPDSLKGFDEAQANKDALNNGYFGPEYHVFMYTVKRNFINQKFGYSPNPGMNTPGMYAKGGNYNVINSAPCINEDFESSPVGIVSSTLAGWSIAEGQNMYLSPGGSCTMNGCCPTFPTNNAWVMATPIAGDPVIGTIPNSPLGGTKVLKMNDNITNKGEVVRIQQTFPVTASNAVFQFAYMAALNGTGHTCCSQPFVRITLIDCSANLIACPQVSITPPGPSCATVSATGWSTNVSGYSYTPAWMVRSIDLSPYIGTCITVQITIGDCDGWAHFGYGYVDCQCLPMAVCVNNVCFPAGSPVASVAACGVTTATMVAPPGLGPYSWTGPTGSGITANPNQTITTTMPGQYTLTMNPIGVCTPITKTVTLTFGVNPNAGFTSANSCTTYSFTNTGTGPPAIQTFSFVGPSSPPTFTSTATTNVVNFAPSTTYTVYQTVTNASLCTASASMVITTPPGPNPAFTATPSFTQCMNGNSFTFNATTSAGTHTYNFNPTVGSPAASATNPYGPVSFTAPGTYTVTHTITNAGCTTAASSVVVVNPNPTVTATYSPPACPGGAGVLNGGGLGAFTWTGPAGFNSAANSPTLIPTATTIGVYTLTSNYLGCFGTATVLVTLPSAPSVTVGNSGPVCLGSPLTFTASYPPGPSYVYWYMSNPYYYGGYNVASPTIAVTTTASAGTYTFYISYPGCPSMQYTTNVQVVSAASATVSNTGPYCVGQTIQLNATAPGAPTYTWSGPGGFTSAVQNPTIALATTTMAGIYTCTANIGGCKSTKTTNVIVNPLPNPVMGSNSPVCLGNNINLTTTGGGTYSWSGPSSYTSILQNPILVGATTAMAGLYTVTVTNTFGCKNTGTVSVTVTTPTTSATNTGPYCAGFPIQLNTPAGASYTWTGPGFSSNVQNPNIAASTTAMSGTYSVTVSNGGCLSNATTSVTVNALPIPAATNTGPYCPGATVQLNVGAYTSYTWNGTSFNSNVQNPTLPSAVVAFSGNYAVTVTDANGCIGTSNTNVLVNPIPIVSASTTSVCANSNLILNSSGGTTYTWTGPGGFTSNAQNPVLPGATLSMNGVYTVIITDANGCVNSTAITATVDPIPTPVAMVAGPVCVGGVLTLSGTGGVTYTWSGPNGVFASASSFTVLASSVSYGGTYNLTAFGPNGCSATAAVNTIVNPLPTAAIISSNNKGCSPVCATFTVSGTGIVTATWTMGDGTTANGVMNTSSCYATVGIYTIGATVTDINGCIGVTTNTAEVYPIPVADFNHAPIKPVLNIDQEVTFTDASYGANIITWNWYFMNTAQYTSTLQNPMFNYTEPGTYAVALVIKSDKGCLDTIVKTLVVGEDYGVYVPNAFTPNDDGLNDTFQPKGFGVVEYELNIFDRWGEKVFHTKNFAEGWDGKFKGRNGPILEEGSYTWLINVTNVFGKAHELKGHVTLIK